MTFNSSLRDAADSLWFFILVEWRVTIEFISFVVASFSASSRACCCIRFRTFAIILVDSISRFRNSTSFSMRARLDLSQDAMVRLSVSSNSTRIRFEVSFSVSNICRRSNNPAICLSLEAFDSFCDNSNSAIFASELWRAPSSCVSSSFTAFSFTSNFIFSAIVRAIPAFKPMQSFSMRRTFACSSVVFFSHSRSD